ncbi:hypothetical protein C6B38_01830 [Spiroplasma sp. ChiS]|uniref:lipoprotein n=1 Tax=Spiroplasma sp. ChiS TaxID=2099885 RepID=UPI000CF9C99A|nr:lipoprotein [Spiroplasma sp. ChiS]PQP79264.1 hypothetical protein C6B38_01830 [Spiroplasma sp. ChiS]
MKKWLSFLGAITLLGTNTTSLVACNTPQYNEEELQQLKQENQIYTNCQEIKENLEWICPQEQPFNQVDNKWYYVVWRGDKSEEWKIVKFKNDKYEQNKILDKYNNYELQLLQTGKAGQGYWKDIGLVDNNGMPRYFAWSFNPKYFKSVYRWNGGEENLPDLVLNNDGNVKVNSE